MSWVWQPEEDKFLICCGYHLNQELGTSLKGYGLVAEQDLNRTAMAGINRARFLRRTNRKVVEQWEAEAVRSKSAIPADYRREMK